MKNVMEQPVYHPPEKLRFHKLQMYKKELNVPDYVITSRAQLINGEFHIEFYH